MHNIKDLRKNLNTYQKNFLNRNLNFKIEEFKNLDEKNKKLINEKERLEQEKKILSKSKEKSNFEKSRKISEKISKISKEQLNSQKINDYLYLLPNIALESVPIGKDNNSNKTLKKVGKIKKFSYQAKSHIEIGSKKNKIDFDTSIKLSGSRFVVLKEILLCSKSLINFMLDIHTTEYKYTEISPLIVNENVMFGTGQLPKFETDQFEIKLENSEKENFLFLLPKSFLLIWLEKL